MLSVRRLVKNRKGAANTVPSTVTGDILPRKMVATSANKEVAMVVKGRSMDVDQAQKAVEEAREKPKATRAADGSVLIETAFAPDGMSGGGQIRNKNMYNSILEGFIVTDIEGTDAVQQGKSKDVSLNRIYRDIYYHDPVCGSAVDLMSNMPFSDFSLAGSKDSKVYNKYEESIDNMNVKSLFPILSNEYLVHGLFVSTTIFDEAEGVFNGIIPQQIDYVEVLPVPVFGRDPLITLMVGEAAESLRSSTDDPRMKEQYGEYLDPKEDTLRPDPDDVIYVPRRGLLRDYRGVSIYKRTLTAWFIERALYRGTLDQSMKRQRSITQLTAGDTDWTPTNEEMNELANNLVAADLDPVGAIFVTRTGVSVSDIRSANDLWKVMDNQDYFTTAKLRSLGISESFLSGDASYNTLEQAMSVFIEQMRAYREMISYELFYNNTFPRIAKANDFYQRRYAMETADGKFVDGGITTRSMLSQGDLFNNGGVVPQYGMWADHSSLTREERKSLFIPQVHWHKRLRPEADDAYLAMLGTLESHGVPIPVRIWAAAGGIDLNSLINQQQDDIATRDKLHAWLTKIHKIEGEMAGQDMGGDMGGGAPGGGAGDMGGGADLSSLIRKNPSAGSMKNMSLLSRNFDNSDAGPKNIAGGKRHIMSAKGAKIADEKANKLIAEVAANVNGTMNRFEQRLDEKFNAFFSTKKIYTP